MSFFKICDREMIDNVTDGLALRVIRTDGLSVNPNYNINVTDLNRNTDGILNKHFHNNGYGGIKFKINVLIYDNDKYGDETVKTFLHKCIKHMKPVYVKCESINIPDKKYIITDNPSRKTNYNGESVWELEFTTYSELKSFKYLNNNMTVADALNNYNKKVKKQTNNTFKKCKLKEMKLNKKNHCCYLLNNKLFKLGHINSKTWKKLTKQKKTSTFTKTTTTALKKFQKKYNKTHVKTVNVKNGQALPVGKKYLNISLNENGKMDNKTFKALQKS